MNKKEINKTLPKHYQKRSIFEKIYTLYGYVAGTCCRLVGKIPPYPCTPTFAADRWIEWLKNHELPPIDGSIIIIALGNQTWMDWAMYAACWMRRLGYAPIILFSSKDSSRIYGGPRKYTLKQKILTRGFWEHVDQIPDALSIDVDNLPFYSGNDACLFDDVMSIQAHTNAAYALNVEEHEQGELREVYNQMAKSLYEELYQETCQAFKLLMKLKAEHNVVRLIGYSGVIGRSACYECAAKKATLRRTWVESWGIRPSLMRWNYDNPALDFNVRDWVDKLAWGTAEKKEMSQLVVFQETGKTEVEDDRKMKHHLKYQIVSSNTKLPEKLEKFLTADWRPVFLLAPNVVGDSATFQRQTIFESQREWIMQVVRYFASNPDKRLIIRAHPSERVYELRNMLKVNLGLIAMSAAKGVENIYVVQWQDPVNTYSLIPHIRAGLTWVSNTGVDLVVRGVPVISAARPVYEKLGITEEPSTKEKYFQWIEAMSRRASVSTDQQKEIGLKYLYIIYKKIGMLGIGLRNQSIELELGHSLDSEYGRFYRKVAGL